MDPAKLRGVRLKIIFLVHCLLASWSTLGQWSHQVSPDIWCSDIEHMV